MNDGRPFWQFIVSASTGCSDMEYFEELYRYYTTEKVGLINSMNVIMFAGYNCHYCNAMHDFFSYQAWHLCDPDAESVFKALRKAGVKVAVVSNFDTRLRPLLQALKCDDWFDAVAVSAEVLHCFLIFVF